MVLTFTGSLSVAQVGRDELRVMLTIIQVVVIDPNMSGGALAIDSINDYQTPSWIRYRRPDELAKRQTD